MLRKIRMLWARSQALSVLQNAYEMSLKFSLSPLDDLTLRQVTTITVKTGGNAFDAAAAFMTLRIKPQLEAEPAAGKAVGIVDIESESRKFILGFARTEKCMRFPQAHIAALSAIRDLKDRIAAQNRVENSN